MADRVWKVFGRSKQLLLNKFFDLSTLSMRKVDEGEKKKKRKEKEMKRMLFFVAITSLPAVDRPNADPWNAACSCQKLTITIKTRYITLEDKKIKYSTIRLECV